MDLVTTHPNADMDGMASMVALHLLHGPLALALPGGMDPDTHRFWEAHQDALPPILAQPELRQRLRDGPFGTLYVADTANPHRLGPLQAALEKFATVRAYDTHPEAEGDLPRMPMAQASACIGSLVLELAERGITPSKTHAGLFLLGLHQDTGHLTFASTTVTDYRAAMQCIAWGAPIDWPGRYVPKGFTRAQLALLEEMGRRAEVLPNGGVPVALVTLELSDYEPNVAVLLEQLREAEGWPAAVAVASFGERAFCIGRSRGAFDVGEVMRKLGGGGHPEAASAVLRGVTLGEAVQRVRDILVTLIGQQNTAGELAARPVVSLPATTSVRDAAEALHRRRINAAPLTRGQGAKRKYVGLVSRQDMDAALRHGFGERPVEEFMGPAPAWVPPETPLTDVRAALVAAAPRRLVLVGTPPRATGVLTRGLVLRAAPLPAGTHGGAKRPPQAGAVVGLVRKQAGAMWARLEQVAAIATKRDMALYLVGGSVRDLFLGVEGRDLDLVVGGDAPTLARAVARKLGGTVFVPEGFGTAQWFPKNAASVDFATARSEYYKSPAALPIVEHASLNQDLFRRDFTLNAMAVTLSHTPGKLHDPYGGLADLRAGLLRVLHGLSFHDDPTRAWRAVRFAARFEFALAPDTLGLLKSALRAGVMEKLSLERLGAEVGLLLAERDVVQGFRLVRLWNLAACISPGFSADRAFLDRIAAAQRARLRLEEVMQQSVSQADLLWVVLAAELDAQTRLDRARMVTGGRDTRRRFLTGPEQVAEAVQALRRRNRVAWGRALAPLDAVLRVLVFAQITRPAVQEYLIWWEREGRHIRSGVDGHLLRARGHKEGPRFKAALQAALDQARAGGDQAAQISAAEAVVAGR